MTREDPKEPALQCPAESIFYQCFREDIKLSWEQCRSLPLVASVPRRLISRETLVASLQAMGFARNMVSDDDVSDILAIVRHPDNPYWA